MGKKALIALHDIAPFHLSKIEKAEGCLNHWGVGKINFLYVPDYHRQREKLGENQQGKFLEWIHGGRRFEVDWILHGLHHERKAIDRKKEISLKRLRGIIWTDKEAEFLDLPKTEIRRRVEAGLRAFSKDLGFAPHAFIAPAWLHKEELIEVLTEMEFDYTEDHRAITALKSGKKYSAPVITWAARSPFRRRLSQAGCGILARMRSRNDLIRIALHPPDFEFPSIIRSIRRVIQSVLAERQLLLYRELSSVLDAGEQKN